jgi:ankyrin repeat protein
LEINLAKIFRNYLKSLVAIKLEPFAEMKMRFISPKMPNRIYKNMCPNEHGIALLAKYGKYWLEDRYGLLDKIGTNVCITGDSFAPNNGHIEVVKFIDAMNTVTNLANDDDSHPFRDRADTNTNWTPLHARIAAYKGHGEILEFLAKEKVDMDCSGNYVERTPISIAAESGHTEIVKFLAVVTWEQNLYNFKQNFMQTVVSAVHAATKFGHTEIVKFLIEFLASKRGFMDLDRLIRVAVEYGHIQVVDFLISKNVKLDEHLLEIAKTKNIKQRIADALKYM